MIPQQGTGIQASSGGNLGEFCDRPDRPHPTHRNRSENLSNFLYIFI
jgi:hypothetical protein